MSLALSVSLELPVLLGMMPISYGGSQWGRLRVESALDLFIGLMILHKEQRYLYRMKKNSIDIMLLTRYGIVIC